MAMSYLCSLAFVATSVNAAVEPLAPGLMRRDAAGLRRWSVREAGAIVAPHDHRSTIERGQHAQELLERSQFSSLNFKRSSSDEVYTLVPNRESLADETAFSVDCADGYTCVGGGCAAREGDDTVVSERDPDVNVEGWRCSSSDNAADKTKKVWAICARSCSSYDGVCYSDEVWYRGHMCSDLTCTENECCHPPPTCESFTGTCPAATHVRRPDDTKCTSEECDIQDCCTTPQKCMEWQGQCSSSFDECEANAHDEDGKMHNVKIPGFDVHICAGAACTQTDCCGEAPTCQTFDDPLCIGTLQGHLTCCSGSCSCALCYHA